MSEYSDIKVQQQQTWATGDFAMIGRNAMLVSELLCEAVDLRAGQTVLDVATGSGNMALAAARHWCEVTGIDFTPTLLDHARERAAAERVPITFQDGDAESLPFADCTFDVVLSTFGVMFAPNQSLAASELLRVCKSGGKIGLTNWTPNGFVGQSGLISAQFVSLATQDLPPTRWGTEKGIQALLGDTVTSLQITKRTTTFRYKSIEHYLDCYRTYFGPMIRAFETLSRLEQKHLQDALIDNVVHFNQSGDETVAVPAEYLEVIAVKR